MLLIMKCTTMPIPVEAPSTWTTSTWTTRSYVQIERPPPPRRHGDSWRSWRAATGATALLAGHADGCYTMMLSANMRLRS